VSWQKSWNFDLGTSNSGGGGQEAGKPSIIPSAEGPRWGGKHSLLCRDHQDGQLLVGNRRAGKQSSTPKGRCCFKRKMALQHKYKVSGKEYSLSNSRLHSSKDQEGCRSLSRGEKVEKSRHHGSAYLTTTNGKPLKDAGAIAGSRGGAPRERTTAACLAYGLDKKRPKPENHGVRLGRWDAGRPP